MDNNIQQLISKLNESFSGRPWYGDSLMTKLNSIDAGVVNHLPLPSQNSIAKLVQHIINWRIFVTKKLQGDEQFDIKQNDKNDWTDIVINGEQDWRILLEQLRGTQIEITRLLAAKEDSFLMQPVPGRKYNYQYLIEGLIQHDIYHLGQIALVKRLNDASV